ncbi:MAG: 1-acyl-sn-glycerol-3-phosphate acyltransferase [Gammaproteobacteria bacterium]|nr:1-acyl-sn-glycerol-3-phosphate acyltransferase [Gammaproteobacteria bacterium]
MRIAIRPVISGSVDSPSDQLVYVLERRSLFDLIVLDLVATQLGIENPLIAYEDLNEQRRFFFLNRAVGARGKVTMYRFSERMQRIQTRLTLEEPPPVMLLPISIYWGRTNEKEGSIARRVVSEEWRTSSGLRRLLGVLFARSDVLVAIHPAIDWRAATIANRSIPLNLRHIARILRTTFKAARVAALGPALVSRRSLVRELASQGQSDPKLIVERRRAANQLVSNMSYPAMRVLKRVLDIFWRRVYDRIELLNVQRTFDIAATHTIVYVPNHRSHVDYLILSYMLFTKGIAIPYIAAGDNLNLPVIGGLLRRCGAFFMRRSYRDDPAYRTLLADYLTFLLKNDHSLEFFIEGTRSRPGWMLEPRLGLLRMIMELQHQEPSRPVAFVPVYIAYERLIESESYRAELLGASKRSENLRDAFSAIKLLRQHLGTIQVSLGKPLELSKLVKEVNTDSNAVQLVASRVAYAINDSAILSPSNLVASAIFSFGTSSISAQQLADRIDFLRGLVRVESLKHDFTVAAEGASDLLNHVDELGMFERDDEDIHITNEILANLAWFRNNTLHTLATPAIVAVVLLNQHEPTTKLEIVRQVAGLLPHVAAVLKFSNDLRSVKRWLTHFRNASLVSEDEQGQVSISEPSSRIDSDLQGLGNLIMPVLECMYVLITYVIVRKPHTLTREELVDQSLTLIHQIADDQQKDAMLGFDNRFFESFLEQLIKSNLLLLNPEEKLEPSPTLIVIQRRSTVGVVSTFQHRIQRYIEAAR